MYCKKCGAEIPDDSVFCNNCGTMQTANSAHGAAQPQYTTTQGSYTPMEQQTPAQDSDSNQSQQLPVYSANQQQGAKRGGCLKTVLIVAAVAFVLFFVFNVLFGGFGSETQETTEPTYTDSSDYTSTDLNLQVRDHYTTIKGSGKDTVTVMVYMIGSDLESDGGCATSDLQEMISSNISGNVHLLVQTGGTKTWQNDVMQNGKVQRWEVTGDGVTELDNLGRLSMVQPSTVSDFIKYCAAKYPANRYELIFWNHGGGTVWGYGSDEIFGQSSLSLAQIDQALTDGGVKFDVIGYDACLMATIENALMLEKHADYLIASEELEPGSGWNYASWLPKLVENTSIEPIELGKAVVDGFVEQNSSSDTLSMIELREVPYTYQMLSKYIESAKGSITADHLSFSQVSQARSKAKTYYDGNSEMVDIVDLVSRLDVDGGDDVVAAINSAVKYRNVCSVRGSNGLSMYFPYAALDYYSSTRQDVESLGFDEQYLGFFDYFVNALAGGQMSFTGRTSIGTHAAPADYSDTTWYDPTVANQYASDSYTEKKITEKGDGYVLQMSDEEWSTITDIGLSAQLVREGDILDLGCDAMWSFDSDGDLKIDFDGTWVAINGQVVPYYTEASYDADSTDKNAQWYNYGSVPATLTNADYKDEPIQIILRWDNDHPDGYVAGYRLTSGNGTVAKGLYKLEAGDKIAFVWDVYKTNGDFDSSRVLNDAVTVTSMDALKVSYQDLGASVTDVSFRLTDIYQNIFYTETAEITYQ